MFKWIFLAQAVVYLLVMPGIRSSLELGYHPPLSVGILAILSLSVGFLLMQFRQEPVTTAPEPLNKLRSHAALTLAVPAFAALYAFTVVAFELLNRRQGSEFMAELYAGLPLYVLAIVRGYEILFVPVALAYAFSGSSSKIGQRVVGFALIASLPFMGVADSRGRLLVLAVYMLCFIRPSTFLKFLYRNVRFYIATAIVVSAFVFYSLQRSAGYASFNEYLLREVYQRFDGLNLVTDLRDAGLLNRIGQFDFEMFSPLLAKIPFLEAAYIAKLLGRTSTKQYFLQDLLGRSQLDAANSMITDPLYFAGWAGILIAFCTLGYIIARIDRFVANGRLFYDLNKSALAIAFVTSFALIENDLMGAASTFVQNYALTALLLIFGFKREHEPKVVNSAAKQLNVAQQAP